MTPCSFIRGNVSEELPAVVFYMENCVPSLKIRAAFSSGILVDIYKRTLCHIPEDYVNVNRIMFLASCNAYLLY